MKSVFVVSRNADFTEGRGPMLIDSIFLSGPEAIKYVEGQGGIFGSPQKVEREKFGFYAYANGFHIAELPVLATAQEKAVSDEEIAHRRALAKLTDEDRKVLGLV